MSDQPKPKGVFPFVRPKKDPGPPKPKGKAGRPKGALGKRTLYLLGEGFKKSESDRIQLLNATKRMVKRYKELILGKVLAAPLLTESGESVLASKGTLVTEELFDALPLHMVAQMEFGQPFDTEVEVKMARAWKTRNRLLKSIAAYEKWKAGRDAKA